LDGSMIRIKDNKLTPGDLVPATCNLLQVKIFR
jgi:hypothetical protein